MSVSWMINGVSLESLGLEFAGGSFRTGAASEMRLRRAGDFTAAQLFAHGAAVSLTRNGALFFQGKARDRSAGAQGPQEGQDIVIVDAWDELEATVYEEPWGAGSGSVMLPIAILGRKANGDAITDSQQIQEAIAFAASAGIAIQMGSIPTGLPLWQSEVRNTSIAEVIRLSLRFHPDWIPWIDHATTPPTLNVTPRASMDLRTIAITDGEMESVNIRRRDDLVVDAVKLTYLTATVIDGEVYRDGVIDKYPVAGPSTGPRVLSTVIELAGAQMQFQKSRIQTRTLPTDQASAKAWLKLKFPHLKDVPDAHFDVTEFAKTLVDDSEPHPDPVNPQATRLSVSTAADLPRELVRGSIEDWMRRRVGRVRIAAAISPTSSATAETQEAIRKGTPPLTVVATNAVTKIYKGVSQWTPPESAPAGIAQTLYRSLEVFQYDGTVESVAEDVTGTRFHGCKLRITGGHADWAGMDALIHAVEFDVATGTMTVSVGPAPFLSAEDMLELQRLIRSRPVTWMSTAERTSNELGAESAPGSKGDTLSGYDIPETFMDPAASNRGGYPASLVPSEFLEDDGDWSVVFSRAVLWEHSLKHAGKPHPIIASSGSGNAPLTDDPEIPLETGENDVWLSIGIAEDGTVEDDEVQLILGDAPDGSPFEPKRPTSGSSGVHVQKVGTITVSSDAGVQPVWHPECTSTAFHLFVAQIEDSGGGVPVYAGYDEGVDKFRKVNNTESDGYGLVDTTEGEDGFGDEIKIKRIRRFGGDATEAPIAVVKGQTATEIQFRGIQHRSSEPQIKVELVGDGDHIMVRGNEKTEDFTGWRCTGISVKDGLVTDATFGPEPTPEDAGGWWGAIEWFFSDSNTAVESGVRQYFENGRLVGVSKFGTGGWEDVEGTEEDDGSVQYLAINTDT